MGEAAFSSLAAQAQYTDQDLRQVRQVFLRAWRRVVPSGQSQPSFVKTMQGATEPYTDFLARLRIAVERAVGTDQVGRLLLETLAYENANPECMRVLDPLRGQGASIAEYFRACAGVGGVEHQASVFATAMATALKPQRQGTCFNCGKPGHFRKDCRQRNRQKGGPPGLLNVPKPQPPGLCKRCGKGRHWTNECQSRTDKDGNPLPNPPSGKLPSGPQSLGPSNNTEDPGANDSPIVSNFAKIPSYGCHLVISDLKAATHGSAAADLPIAENVTLSPGSGPCKLQTSGFGPLPQGTFALLLGRRSAALRGITVFPGVIDPDYRGEICIVA